MATTTEDLHNLRSLLTPHGTARVKDPDFVDSEKDNTPPIANPTEGPHRMTFVVPHDDESVVNVGKADPGPHRINETGITGKTKSHVHWHTTEEPETIISLGKPAPSLKIADSRKENLIASNEGYGLFTMGEVWQDSEKKFSMVSREEDITVQTKGEKKVAALQADQGKALVFGKENATLASASGVVIGAIPSLTAQNVALEATWDDKWRLDLYSKVYQTINEVGELGTAALGIITSISKTKTVGSEGKTGPADRPRVGSKAKLIADLGLWVAGILHGWDEVKGGEEPPGTTAIHAEESVSVTGGKAAAIFGRNSATLSSTLSAGVVGGVSALLKGLLWTEVASSLGTGITSIKDVEIAAVKGKLEVSAKKEAVIAVEDGPIVITSAKKIAQLNCNDGHAAVHGSKGAYIGAGTSGFGMQIETSEMKLGKASNAGEFESPGIDPTASITIGSSEIKLVLQQSKIEMGAAETKIAVGGGSIEITPGQVKVDAPMICLG